MTRPFARRTWFVVPVLIGLVLFVLWTGGPEVATDQADPPEGEIGSTTEAENTMANDAQTLEPGATLERELTGGETHSYELRLEADQFVHAVADQRGIDVVVRLFDPQGTLRVEVDSPNGTQGPEEVSEVSEAAGLYRLEILSPAEGAEPGRYALSMDPPRPATAADRDGVAAERAFARAEHLRRQREKGAYREALPLYEEALAAWRRLGDPARQTDVLHRIGWLHHTLGRYGEALEVNTEALQLFRRLGDLRWQGVLLNRIGSSHLKLGDAERSLQSHEEALSLFRELGDEFLEASALNSLGLAHSYRDEVEEALEAYRNALSIYRSLKSPREADVLHNLGETLMYQGKLEEALDSLDQALAIRQAEGQKADEAITLNRLGDVHQRLGHPQRALELLHRALEVRRRGGNPRSIGITLNSLANAYLKSEQPDEALRHAREALKILRTTGNPHDLAVALGNRARLYFAEGDPQKALDLYREALPLLEETGRERAEASCRFGMAEALRAIGSFAEALDHLRIALDNVEGLRTAAESQDLRIAFFASKQDYFELLIDVLMSLAEEADNEASSQGYAARALEVSERRRARGLLDILPKAQAEIHRGVDPGLREQEQAVQRRLNALERSSMKARDDGAGNDDERIVAIAEKKRALLRQLAEVRALIRSKSAGFAALTRPEPLTLDEIRRQVLDRGTLLLVYSLGEERSFLWSVSQRDLTSHSLPPREQIRRAVRQASDRWTRQARNAAEATSRSAAGLSRILLEPVAAQLGRKRLVIVADDALHDVPFAALPEPDSLADAGSALPLVVHHEIVYLPSATVLATLRTESERADRAPAPRRLAVVADPVFSIDDPRVRRSGGKREEHTDEGSADLRRSARDLGISQFQRLIHSSDEARSIAALVPEDQRLEALGFAANRDLVTGGELSRYRVLHFATHGLLNDEHPELSGLVLSLVDESGRPQDGFLRAHEIYNLDLPAELVVLSACQTGSGKKVRGEGQIGLTRGFLYAGVPRVIVSLWNVSDESTAELMKRFYREIFENNLRPSAALRKAQTSMQGDAKWSSPYHWAGFTFQGEWRLDFESRQKAGGHDGGRGDDEFEEQDTGTDGGGDLADQDFPDPYNGVDGVRGTPLPAPMTAKEILKFPGDTVLDSLTVRRRKWWVENWQREQIPDRIPGEDVDPLDLASSGWGVVFAPHLEEDVKEALRPLLEHRRTQATREKEGYYQEYTLSSDESATKFLSSRCAGFGPAHPKKVPYYLLLVGDPRDIPFRFQYELDMQYAVGRLHFERAEHYARYAESAIAAESAVVPLPRKLTFFAAAANSIDTASQRLRDQLIGPLARELDDEKRWSLKTVLEQRDDKERLRELLGGQDMPALLFTGGHGLRFSVECPEQTSRQGALLCQAPADLQAGAPLSEGHYFAAHDIDDKASLQGLIAFFFACYSAGCPDVDNFSRATLGQPERIAPYPFVSRLAQRLLSHENGGALAVLGHVDRAWTTSFDWGLRAEGEIEVFESTLKRLLKGHPVGSAMEYVNLRYADLSVRLNNLLQDREEQRGPSRKELARVWRANNDARNFVVLGDPAVRLTGRNG